MVDYYFAAVRALHVLAVVLWIGFCDDGSNSINKKNTISRGTIGFI